MTNQLKKMLMHCSREILLRGYTCMIWKVIIFLLSGISHGSGLHADADNDETLTCVGDGAYDGLTAILFLDWTNTPRSPVPLAGLIFSGEAPPLPESPASE